MNQVDNRRYNRRISSIEELGERRTLGLLQDERRKAGIKRDRIRKSTGEIQGGGYGRQAVATDVANNPIAGKSKARLICGAIAAMTAVQLFMAVTVMQGAGNRDGGGWDDGRNEVGFEPCRHISGLRAKWHDHGERTLQRQRRYD